MKVIKYLLLIVCILTNINIFAIDVTIENISYSLDLSSRTASVTGSTLENVIVPETIINDDISYSVIEIAKGAFAHNTIIKSIKATSIKRINSDPNAMQASTYFGVYYSNFRPEWGVGAFQEASNLEIVDFGDALEEIGGGAFYQAGNLSTICVGKSLKRIESKAFQGCMKLKYIIIPSTIDYINDIYGSNRDISQAFYNCPLLSIICLKEGYSTGLPKQTIYPSSFFTFTNSNYNYTGETPEVKYTFNGVGCGFKPSTMEMQGMEATAGAHTSYLHCIFANNDMSFEVDIPYSYTIKPITLKAKVADASREYGDANPEFTSTYTGFVNNEDTSVLTSHGTFTTTAKATSDVGTYAIKQTGATAQNYVFEYEDGKLTVNKAPLTMTANNKSITYGNKLPSFDVTYMGLKNNETKPKWTKTPTITSTATADSDAGTYPIEINDADATNYTLTTANGTLTINKAALSIKADNKNKLYGETNPELTCSYVGFVKNQTNAVLNSKPQLNTTATTNSAVGIYPIEVSGAEATNYSISYQNAELTINKRELSVTANNYTRAYGEENPEFELTYQGFVNNEDESVLKVKPTVTTLATSTSDVGEYIIAVDGGVSENYNIQCINGILTIEKAYQTLTWDQDFDNIKKFDKIDLYAEASSGLEITYTCEGSFIGTICYTEGRIYFDCFSSGETVIVAYQKGNKNFWESNKVYKSLVVNDYPDTINGHEYVDLGLASGNLWAMTNYEASTPEGRGSYVDWKSQDFISQKWGPEWTIPSLEDIKELENSCSWTWSSYGYTITGNNGNSIFLPASGCLMTGKSFAEKYGEWVYYWTSTRSGEMASIIMCTSSNVWYGEMNVSYTKLPIRPVAKGASSDLRGIKFSSNDNSQDNIYDMKGQKLNGLKKGLNIIKYKDGTTKKIIVK